MSREPHRVTSRDNPLLVRLRKTMQDPAAYRKTGQVWLEGEHLCQAWGARMGPAREAVMSESAYARAPLRALAQAATRVVVVPDALFATVSALESPAGVGFLVEVPPPAALEPGRDTLVLDRLQDPGNVGAILRTAAAFGVRQIVALKGTVALWSAKVLRAGMGAHFGLRLHEAATLEDVLSLGLALVGTSSHAPHTLVDVALPRPLAWVVGHEGQGIAPAVLARCALTVRIPQPGGQESLNAAAAAAICLYESLRQRG